MMKVKRDHFVWKKKKIQIKHKIASFYLYTQNLKQINKELTVEVNKHVSDTRDVEVGLQELSSQLQQRTPGYVEPIKRQGVS